MEDRETSARERALGISSPRRLVLATVATIGLAVPGWLLADTLTLPNTFRNGDVADANQVNANFAAVKTAVDANTAQITALSSGSSGLSKVRVARLVRTNDLGGPSCSTDAKCTAVDETQTCHPIFHQCAEPCDADADCKSNQPCDRTLHYCTFQENTAFSLDTAGPGLLLSISASSVQTFALVVDDDALQVITMAESWQRSAGALEMPLGSGIPFETHLTVDLAPNINQPTGPDSGPLTVTYLLK